MTTTTTRLAEIAERLSKASGGEWRIVSDASHLGNRRITSAKNPHIAKVYAESLTPDETCEANAAFIAHAHQDIPYLLAQLTAAQERTREDAEIMREAEGLVEASNLRHVHSARVWCCNICDAEVRDDAMPNMRTADACNALRHTPDCIVTKLRERADELGGRADG